MKVKFAMIITAGLSIGAVADNFIWLNENNQPMMQKNSSGNRQQNTEKEQIADPNIGYYIDAKKNRVVALIDLEKNKVTKTDQTPPKELEIGMHRNTIMTEAKPSMANTQDENMKLW